MLHQADRHDIKELYVYEGVEVFPPGRSVAENLVVWSEIILTHLEFTNWTIQMGRIFKRPVVYISHNTSFEAYDCVRDNPQVGVIYNSEAMREKSPFQNPCVVLHPPVNVALYDPHLNPESAAYITLINCNENKGGKIFSRLAAAMPQKHFLAVKGSYDEQFIPSLPNVAIMENTPDIMSVYRVTRVLLMPSRYESWGMTAGEAMLNGIPVIACPTFGLKENCGEAGVFIPLRGDLVEDSKGNVLADDGESYDIRPLISAIKKLDDKKAYKVLSEKCRKKAKDQEPKQELEQCESFLLSLSYG